MPGQVNDWGIARMSQGTNAGRMHAMHDVAWQARPTAVCGCHRIVKQPGMEHRVSEEGECMHAQAKRGCTRQPTSCTWSWTRANAERVTANIDVLKTKQVRMPDLHHPLILFDDCTTKFLDSWAAGGTCCRARAGAVPCLPGSSMRQQCSMLGRGMYGAV